MNCKICNTNNDAIFSAKILGKYTIKYYQCEKCNYLQTEEPFWLDEAYNSSINISDTGIIRRNISVRNALSPLLLFFFGKNKTYLDYAGGYGILTRMMRDEGFDFYTSDPYTSNILAKGFDYENNKNIALITALECFEHYVDPLVEIEKMLLISKNIFFTTKLLPKPLPKPEQWYYFGLSHGQHTSLYNKETLQYLGNKYGLNFYSIGGSYHLFTEKKINKLAFFLIIGLGKFGFIRWLKFFMKSKDQSDYDLLVAKRDYLNSL